MGVTQEREIQIKKVSMRMVRNLGKWQNVKSVGFCVSNQWEEVCRMEKKEKTKKTSESTYCKGCQAKNVRHIFWFKKGTNVTPEIFKSHPTSHIFFSLNAFNKSPQITGMFRLVEV